MNNGDKIVQTEDHYQTVAKIYVSDKFIVLTKTPKKKNEET